MCEDYHQFISSADMILLTWVRVIGLLAAVLSVCRGQIFPFSSLKHFFDQKPRTLTSGAAAAGPSLSKSGSEVKPLTVPPPPPPKIRGKSGGAEAGEPLQLLPTPVPAEQASATHHPFFSGPLSYFDEEDAFRDFRPPPGSPPDTQPAKPTRPGGKRRKQQPSRSPLYIPLSIAYENNPGDGQPPSLFLTPPPAPNPLSPDAEPHVANTETLETAASSSLPPVPDPYLRPPSRSADMTFFKYPDDALSNSITQAGQLELSDVALAAVSASKNPAIVKEASVKATPPPDEKVPPNHKTASQYPGNALDGPRHKDEYGTPLKPVKVSRKPVKGGDSESSPSNHRPAFEPPKVLAENSSSTAAINPLLLPGMYNDSMSAPSAPDVVYESSPSEAAALGPSRPRPPHHKHPAGSPGAHPNHRPQPVRPSKPSGKPQKHANSNKGPPSKHHNHQPDHRDHLDVEESMGRPKYRKHHNHQPYRPLEQEVAESGLHQEGGIPHSSDGDRVEFQMHGLEGPKSYKFGYDTGKGHNRQFRYEERDHHGNVKGHYGYVDQHGKLQIVNYKADPHHGYSADVSKLQL